MAREINLEQYNNEIVNSDKLVLIDFFATWCGPCKMLAPVIEQIADEHDDIEVAKVDTDKEPELAVLFGVSSIPTLVFLKKGQLVKMHIGYASKTQLEAMIEECK